MIDLNPPCRTATLDDAHALAELVNMAGEGMPLYFWGEIAEAGETAWDVGRDRARRESGGFSYRNAVVRDEESRVIACMIGYPLEDNPQPADYDAMPDLFVPLQQLEDLVPGTWYVNVLATYPDFRGKGYGRELLTIAEQIAHSVNKNGMSVIVSDTNPGAKRLYESLGYHEYDRRAKIKNAWQNEGGHWILLCKNI